MAWYDPDWSYRKPLVITGGPSGGQSNFQIDLAVAHVTDHMQTDFDDLRFTQADGTTLIDAWLESKVDDTSAAVWAEFPSTPANTVEQDYYMYYGNGLAASYWDIENTFLFGEDFDDVSDWTKDYEYGSPTYSFVATTEDGYNVGNMTVGAANTNHQIGYSKGVTPDIAVTTTNCKTRFRYKAGTSNLNLQAADPDTTPQMVTAWYGLSQSWAIGDVFPDTNATLSDLRLRLYANASGTQNVFFDWFTIRKYASGPPTYAFGSEESAPTTIMPLLTHLYNQLRQ